MERFKMANIDLKPIEWPEERNISNYVPQSSVASTIQNLFTNTGIVVSVIYVIIKQIIVPSLDAHYLQRTDMSAATLLQLRRTVVLLQRRLKYTSVSELGFSESNGMVERATQTYHENDGLLPERENRWRRFNDKLKEANNELQHFGLNDQSSKNMDSFHLQVKLLVDSIKLDDNSEKTQECCNRIVRSVREAKGWLINGRSS